MNRSKGQKIHIGMESKLIFTVSCLAAVSLAVFVYAIHHNKKNTRRPIADEKPQKKFKCILADNSQSPFVHFQHQREQNGDATTVSHPYGDQIHFLLEHPTQPLKFSLASEPLSMEGPYTWIDKRSELEALSQVLCLERVFAVDTEQHSLRSFLGFTALVQISTQEDDYLLDTIALHDDMCLLRSVFANPAICKVFHGADSDILWLQRDFHIYVVNLFDTARACDVLAKPQRSLAYLLQTYCGISPNKVFQRADWRLRPLPEAMVQYARADAHYLLYIADCLSAELNDKYGSNLFEETVRRSNLITLQLYEKEGASSGQAAAASILSRYYSSQGTSSSKSRESILKDGRFGQLVRKLCVWRDSVARAEDESLRFILSDQAIIFLAKATPTSPKKIYSTISAADSMVQSVTESSFMTPVPSPSPVVYMHIKDLCNLLKEDVVSKNGNLQEDIACVGVKQGNYCGNIQVDNWEGHTAGKSSRFNSKRLMFSEANRGRVSKRGSKEASRAQFVRKFSCKSPVYHNCRIYASDGRLLCYCDQRKLDWYIRRDLAELIEDDPPAVKLLFEPKGRPEDENNEFYIQSKKNMCVGCGESNHYLRYRIIPSCYRMHFPEHLKSHRSHDIVLLCVDCHEIAHSAAEKYKRQVAAKFGIPLFARKVVDSRNSQGGVNGAEFVADGGERGVSPLQLRIAAMALLRHGSTMPKERREELELVIKNYYEGTDITREGLEAALLVGMGPREKRRLSKKKGLVFKQLGINSISMDSSGSKGNEVESSPWRSTLSSKGTDAELISSPVVEENLPNFVEYEDLCFNQDNDETKTIEAYTNCSATMDEEPEDSLLSGVTDEVEESIDCLDGQSNTHSNGTVFLGGDLYDQRIDEVGVTHSDKIGIDAIVEEQCNSFPNSLKLNQAVGSDYISEASPEPITGGLEISKRAQKISLLGHGPHGKRVVEKLLQENGEDGIREFCQQWRVVFVEAVKPCFLPAGWDIHHSGRREFGEYSVYNPSKRN